MHFKDGGYYHVANNKWTHLGSVKEEAMQRFASIEHGLSISPSAAPAWMSMSKYLHELFWRAQKNAKLRSLEFLLSRDDYDSIVTRASGSCEVTSIPFSLLTSAGCNRRPFAPSLDRIDSALGYTPANCRLVCGIVNAALGAWGEGVFWKMVKMSKKKRISKKNEVVLDFS